MVRPSGETSRSRQVPSSVVNLSSRVVFIGTSATAAGFCAMTVADGTTAARVIQRAYDADRMGALGISEPDGIMGETPGFGFDSLSNLPPVAVSVEANAIPGWLSNQGLARTVQSLWPPQATAL